MVKKKVIVYGLGKEYSKQKKFIENRFDIVGYSDSKKNSLEGEYILPENISHYEYDYIYVTSSIYFKEIRDYIISLFGADIKSKIISLQDVFGDFRNGEIRHQWVIEKLAEIPEGKVLVDAGAGEQRYKSYCEHLKYIAQDFGKYVPSDMDVGIQSDSWDYTGLNIVCDIIDMPLNNESVDVVLCTEVFEHLKNPILAIKEFSRILRSNGKLILTAPFCSLTHMAPYYFYNGFSEFWYKENLGEYGFEISEMIPYGNFFKYLCQKLFRVNEIAERYCNLNLKAEEVDAIANSIQALSRLSQLDNGSSEVLCFGYMLVATKK